ncbi:hypothetical protein HG530_015230 [Fusarium avenaceum]|nr:hypothetical protein HG530_015230 [Fusarium avenaceum]
MIPEGLDILAIESRDTAEGCLNHVAIERKEALGDLSHTWVDIIERSDEDRIFTIRVEFLMNCALGKHRHLEGVHGVGDRLSAILDDEVGNKAAFNNNIKLGCSVVDVGGVHSTWPEKGDCHRSSVTDEGRHGKSSSRYGFTALANRLSGSSGRNSLKVKDVVARLVQELDSLGLGRGGHDLGN